jgi:tetratricopeptide (TPR) repeat protein
LKNLLRTVASSSHPASWYESVMAKTSCLVLKANESAKADIRQLQAFVRDIFSDDEFPSATIVVDALSNCRDSDVKLMVDCLQLLAKLPNTKVVILTQVRPAMDCEHIIRIDADRVGSEVLKYSKARISRTPGLESMKLAILNTISAKSLGMFLYAKLLLDDLARAATPDDCEEILMRAPNGLWEYFDRLWRHIGHDLSPANRAYRNAIFCILVAAREPLHPDTIAHYVALDLRTNRVRAGSKFNQPRVVVEDLCRPFIVFMESDVEIAHPSMKQYIQEHILSDNDPNAYLAEKCLSQLSSEQYSRPSYAASSLRRHLVDPGVSSKRCISMTDDEAIPYDYAVRHWQDHMFAVPNPSRSLLSRLATFITRIEVVSWSERLADLKGNNAAAFLNAIIDIRAALRDFIGRLPSNERKDFPLEDFFVKGHEKLRQNLTDDDEGDHLVPYLPSLRLGQWYSISGKSYTDFRKAYYYKELVVEGFTRVLGKRSPLTLKARTSWVNEFWFQELILEAVAELTDIVEDYSHIVLDDKEPYLRAIQNLGVGQYLLTDFTSSMQSLHDSGEGLLKIEKEKEWVYQVNDLYKAWVLERQGALEAAQEKLESILKLWAPVAGESNGLTLMAKTALGSVYRKQREYGKAVSQLLFAWRERFKLFTIDSNTTVDSGLHLAITFREMDKLQESEDILDQLEKSDVFNSDIGRQNQVTHVRALIEFDRGNFGSPKNKLIQAVQETTGSDRSRNNRAALWIRTTAADALRHEGKDSEALMLFSELVEPSQDSQKRPLSPTLVDEPEPVSQLALAEGALRYVQNRDQAAAEELLEKNGLQWVRKKDFWIQQGGPPADTAWMKPPNYEDFIKMHPP